MSNQPSFTKGIWSQSHRKQMDGMYITQVYDDKGESICNLNWHAVDEGNGVTSTDREANAQLIAEAPELYAELEMVCKSVSETGTVHPFDCIRIGQLLAKIRGES
jgi:hypothetical protein